MSSKAALIWSVRMKVPATIATPSTMAIDVRTVRSLRAMQPADDEPHHACSSDFTTS